MKIKIIDNFLDKEDFNKLCSIELENINSNQIKVYHNEINNNRVMKNNKIEKNFLKKLNDKYLDTAFKILRELNPNKLKLYEYTDFTLIHTGSHCKFPIHDDTPNKLLSGVIYLSPKKNSGTIFYKNKNGEERKEINWEQNRAVFFSREEKKTWHSYEGNKEKSRVALVYNLMTTKIKEVSKIENTNFIFSYLRFKLNPHLYRFLKFTI
ncbi:hypothetical protein OAM09_04365 [Candidatus Pelagibacter sp.]|nr:hypothetical protein [Candidatus Pelagibacter sp.]